MRYAREFLARYIPESLSGIALFGLIFCVSFALVAIQMKPVNAEEPIPTPAPTISAPVLEEPEDENLYEVPAAATSFKAWMPYTAITDKTSDQWQMQQSAWTDNDGFRRYGEDGCYMVAMGTYYAQACGKVFDVTFESGETLRCIVGDIKDDKHTDELHQHRNGNVVEFIVDKGAISRECRIMGDMSWSEGVDLTGKPVQIKEVI